MMKMTTHLRDLIARPGALVVPGVYDALSARICEMVGFEAVFHSGYGTAAVHLGQPDIGLLDMTEMSSRVRSIARAVRIPVLGDSDHGFGNAVNAYRTVQEYLWAGRPASSWRIRSRRSGAGTWRGSRSSPRRR